MISQNYLQRGLLARLLTPALVLGTLAVTAWLAWWLGSGLILFVNYIVMFGVGFVLAIVVGLNPYLGLIVIVITLPLQGVLRQVPFGPMLSSLMGGLAVAGFILSRKGRSLSSYGLPWQFKLALAFILWQFVSHPQAAYYGTRNFVFTFFQLWIIMWLASEMLTPERQVLMMRVYVAAAVVSALVAFSEANIVADFSAGSGLERGIGLAENQNSLAFYLSLAIVMNAYLHSQSTRPGAGQLYSMVYVALILGVVGTVSRAGFVSMLLAFVLSLSFWLREPERARRIILPGLIFVLAGSYFIPDAYWEVMENSLLSGDIDSEENLGSRAVLMDTGLEVWKDNPVVGVGIDQFRLESRHYLSREWQHLYGQVQHNFYIALLSETGLIGFLLFLGWMMAALVDLWRALRLRQEPYSSLALTWLILIGLFLFRGFTASTMHYDKLLFMMGGISILLYRQALAARQAEQTAGQRVAVHD